VDINAGFLGQVFENFLDVFRGCVRHGLVVIGNWFLVVGYWLLVS
jgi:hypothetical protein